MPDMHLDCRGFTAFSQLAEYSYLMSCFSLLFSVTTPATCSTEVLPDSVFGIRDESVADSGTVNKRTNGDELQHWIPVFGPKLLSLSMYRVCHSG